MRSLKGLWHYVKVVWHDGVTPWHYVTDRLRALPLFRTILLGVFLALIAFTFVLWYYVTALWHYGVTVPWHYVTDRLRALPLFRTILLWVFLALIAFTTLGSFWGEGPFWSWQRWLTNWRSAGDRASPLDIVKVSLTTIGGIGGTGYLVIKYRERASAERAERDAEQERAEQRLLSGVQQLGSESPQVRIAGVYSLADVADTYRGEYRQRVVSILCGYLRTQRGEWRTIVNEQDGPEQSSEEKVYVSHDGAVESTVLEVLVRHLRKRCEKTKHREAVTQLVEDDQLWCDCTIDLHDAVLTEIANFEGVTFNRDADFKHTTFTRTAAFGGASFTEVANFGGANFIKDANFEYTTFRAHANFQDATFTNANFQDATLTNANFQDATLTNANFQDATLNQSAPPIGLPSQLVDPETGLPKKARWARFNDEGEVIEEDSPTPDTPSEDASSS